MLNQNFVLLRCCKFFLSSWKCTKVGAVASDLVGVFQITFFFTYFKIWLDSKKEGKRYNTSAGSEEHGTQQNPPLKRPFAHFVQLHIFARAAKRVSNVV